MGKLAYNFNMLVTPVKPLNLKELTEKHFYHSNSDVSAGYIPAALQAGANRLNVHHKKTYIRLSIILIMMMPYLI